MKHLPIGNAEYINRLNKIKILSLIREQGEISRAELVKRSGVSAPTVTRIVDSLINREKLVVELGAGESSGGRPPLMVIFNGSANYIIGIDWGRTHIYGVLANLNAETILEIDLPTEINHDFETDLNKLFGLIEFLIEKSGIDKQKLLGIGVAAAGFVNRHNGIIEFSPNFNWKNVDIRRPIEERFDVRVKVDNVSRLMALGELWYGIGQKIRNFIFINIGYGIGAGIIIDGKPFAGADGISGEFGHLTLLNPPAETRTCLCGKANCLESFASGRGIAETARLQAMAAPKSLLSMMCSNRPERLTAELTAKAARAGDETALTIFTQTAEMLGISAANFAHLFNPEAVVLGGKVSNAGDFFFDKIHEVFNREQLPFTSRKVKLIPSELKESAAVKGAVSLILQEVLNLNVFP
ncbi:MAG TPA: ROK family transcriptional regulator [Prolixibacteraceae bacterium]|nr:ROK family transcriptional regulator [Prolixibacteraceae bacterium]